MSGSTTSSQQLSHILHLTDAQFSDLLAGATLDSRSEAHLAACSLCRAEAETVSGSLAEFNNFSVVWAEREAPRRVRTPSRWALRWGAHPAWNAGVVAAAAAVVFTVGLHLPQHTAPAAVATPAMGEATGAMPSGAELAEDNRLLSSIDQELSSTPQPTVSLADLNEAGHPAPESLREPVTN